MCQDTYWTGVATVKVNGESKVSEEDPSCTNWDRFVQEVIERKATIEATGVLVIEGFQSFHDKRLVEICDLSFHLDAPKHLIVQRRSACGTADQPNPHPKSVDYCDTILWPTHEKYMRTSVDPLQGIVRLDVSEVPFSDILQTVLSELDTAPQEPCPAYHAAKAGDFTRMVELIARHPHQVQYSSNTSGYTLLHQAAWHGNQFICGFLVALGANVGAKNQKGETAASVAQLSGHTECAQALLSSAATAAAAGNASTPTAAVSHLTGTTAVCPTIAAAAVSSTVAAAAAPIAAAAPAVTAAASASSTTVPSRILV
jgi:uridine kinase